MTQNLFDQNDIPETPDQDQNQEPQFEDLVGEGKKYRDAAAVAKAVYEKDRFIDQLKSELHGLRGELSSRVKMEEFLERMSSMSPTQNEPQVHEPDGQTKGIDLDKVLDQKLSELEQRRNLQQNLDRVRQELQAKLGANYKSHLKQISDKLGLGEQFMNALAAEQPKAFMHLVGLDKTPEPQSSVTPPTTSFRPQAPTSGKRNYKYYADLKKADPVRYYSVPVQQQWFKDTEELGAAFFDD